jgi:hypothetical protein
MSEVPDVHGQPDVVPLRDEDATVISSTTGPSRRRRS